MKPFIHHILSGLWTCLLCVPALAQTGAFTQAHSTSPYVVTVRHFSKEQGLPNRFVLTIGQDHNGQIWVGTQNNAYRFDGSRFSPLPPLVHAKGNTPFAPNIHCILTDYTGNLWLESEAGQVQIIRKGQQQPQVFADAFNQPDPFRQDPVLFPSQQSDNFRYMLTRSGRIYRMLRQGRVQAIGHFLPAGKPMSLVGYCETNDDRLWVSITDNAVHPHSLLIQYDSLGRICRQFTLPDWLVPFGCDPDGTLYLHGSNTRLQASAHRFENWLYRLTPAGRLTGMTITSLNNPGLAGKTHLAGYDMRVRYDRQRGLFWISNKNLLLAWHPVQGIVFDLATMGQLPVSVRQDIRSVFIDRTGAVWAPTDDGVLLVTPEPNRFRRYLHVPEEQASTNRHSIRGMFQEGNRLWVNSEESMWVDLTTGRSSPTLPPDHPLRPRQVNLYPLIRDPAGMLWSGCTSLLQINPAKGPQADYEVKPYRGDPAIFPMPVYALRHDGRHTIWVGFTQGLTAFDRRTNTERPFTQYNRFPELAGQRVNGFFPDQRAKGIWVAASSGLYLLDTLRGIVARYGTYNRTLPFDHITFVHPDRDEAGVYWLATRGGGLIKWNRQTGRYRQFTTQQGGPQSDLPDNSLYAIYEDRHARLWLPSDYGLISFHRKTSHIQSFHVKDGIADEEFNLTAHHRAPDGRLFLGGLNGITAFYPDSIRVQPPPATPLITTQYQTLDVQTGIMVDQTARFEKEHQINLSASDRLFTLSFALFDYRYLTKTRLWYRIAGWQDQWTVQNQMDLRINGLPAGEYTLQVRAQTINGDWISPVLTIPVRMAAPFYQQPWFIVLLCLLFAVGLVSYVRWRNRKLLRDKARLETEVTQRTAQIERDKATIARQAARLQASATLKARFFANVSHEFRTPLTLLIGPIRHLAGAINDTRTKQLLAAMERNTHHLLQLVNDLLDLSRLDEQQVRLTEQPTDLSQLIDQTLTALLPQAQYAGIHLVTKGFETPQLYLLDGPKLETVLRNLIANALRHTPAGGTITLSLSVSDTEITLSVTDTGEGIHPDDLPHIFERYFQSNQPDKPLKGGTGIGLALCLEFCQLWGGRLTVNSQLNQGSTFTVSYPVRTIRIQPVPSTDESDKITVQTPLLPLPDPASAATAAGTETILLVDDNPDILLYITAILSSSYQVKTARNGREALNQLTGCPPDALPGLILSDVMMPEMDGLSFVTALRQKPALRAIPVVLLTARADLDARLQALQLGVADYLTKPFHEAELMTRIQNLLNRAHEQAIWQKQSASQSDALTPDNATEMMTDEAWIGWLQQQIRQQITNAEFNVRLLAEQAFVSERVLYRRIKVSTGLTPNQLIQEVRLQVAHELLRDQPNLLLKTIAGQVGYQKVSYFRQLYEERFGINLHERSVNRIS